MGKVEAKPTCGICGSEKYVDGHHYDCQEGKLSPETIPLCRRCHRTYHDLGVEWFEEQYLDKAIKMENKRREIVYSNLKEPVKPLELLRREDIKRTDYYNKTHGLPVAGKTRGSQTPAFTFRLPHGEPLCGWDWVNKHLYDLVDWVPRIEIVGPGLNLATDINSKKKLRDIIKAIKAMRELE